MQDPTIARGELLFLWHPVAPYLFSGYGLAMREGRKSHLVGLLMVDRPRPVPPAWLEKIKRTFGDYALVPMTASGERGIACHMHVEANSLDYVHQLSQPTDAQIQNALTPLLAHPPRPHLRVRWDPIACIWHSSFYTEKKMNPSQPVQPLFSLGQVVATPGALAALERTQQSPIEFLVRHVSGDWGDLPPEDIQANGDALTYGSRLLSAYNLADSTRIWLITEWDRSVTTLLLPSEY